MSTAAKVVWLDNTGNPAKVGREVKEGILTNGTFLKAIFHFDETDKMVGTRLLDISTTALSVV